MKRISFLLVAAATISTNVGCGCCGWCLPKPQPIAVAPACPPPCDPCATAPVTYGTPAPVAPYTPPPQW